MNEPLIVGISGASGAIYGIEALRILKELGRPTHLIISEMGQRTISIETEYTMNDCAIIKVPQPLDSVINDW